MYEENLGILLVPITSSLINSTHQLITNIGCTLTGVLPVLKRKRGAMVGLLNWLRAVAKKPCDSSYKIDSCLKDAKCGKSNPTTDYFTQALILRKEMFIKKIRKDCSVVPPKQVSYFFIQINFCC